MAQGKSVSSSPPPSAPKPGSQLDNMLGSLQSDLNKLGVATVAKGVCGACKKPIAGQVSGAPCSSGHFPQASPDRCSHVFSCRWSRRWGGLGTRNTLCAPTARRRSALATSLSETGSRTVRRTTTTCSPRAASTATGPSWIKW
ncbi:hypothetical protein FKM82_022662 [Ascaphus truei]